MSIPAYLKYVALTVLFLLATVNFTRTTLSVIESSRRLDEVEEDISALEVAKTGLEKELDYKESLDYVEKEARNKLGLVKPGEQLFVTFDVLGSAAHNDAEKESFSEFSNVNLWIELFF